ncbi:hypothetical protein Pcinc_038923 [Petrolisthes cinctipes]|uniref:Uncharacterized protein n=1 Tax=Petrolisthes cinctipes TaxID=88211 RepID=A0AAE1EMJ1_PETCI|nr:hypothetical protein Pcinc_038923 [Petrolisthes cinctipes]
MASTATSFHHHLQPSPRQLTRSLSLGRTPPFDSDAGSTRQKRSGSTTPTGFGKRLLLGVPRHLSSESLYTSRSAGTSRATTPFRSGRRSRSPRTLSESDALEAPGLQQEAVTRALLYPSAFHYNLRLAGLVLVMGHVASCLATAYRYLRHVLACLRQTLLALLQLLCYIPGLDSSLPCGGVVTVFSIVRKENADILRELDEATGRGYNYTHHNNNNNNINNNTHNPQLPKNNTHHLNPTVLKNQTHQNHPSETPPVSAKMLTHPNPPSNINPNPPTNINPNPPTNTNPNPPPNTNQNRPTRKTSPHNSPPTINPNRPPTINPNRPPNINLNSPPNTNQNRPLNINPNRPPNTNPNSPPNINTNPPPRNPNHFNSASSKSPTHTRSTLQQHINSNEPEIHTSIIRTLSRRHSELWKKKKGEDEGAKQQQQKQQQQQQKQLQQLQQQQQKQQQPLQPQQQQSSHQPPPPPPPQQQQQQLQQQQTRGS